MSTSATALQMAVRGGLVLCLLATGAKLAQAQMTPPASPFASGRAFTPAGPLDEIVLSHLQKKGLQPANLSTDEAFFRRVYFDVIGTLPSALETREFLQDKAADKRARLIDALLAREEFADYWALKWGDLLRIKSEFPINLWPNAVQAYHQWVREALRQNKPYDQFARELLTSSGSNFRVPPVNFYRAVQGREPVALAGVVALTLMGQRLDRWPDARRNEMAAFFSRLSYKKTGEWKEEIICLDPAATEALQAVLPDGTKVRIPVGKDPRIVFADWLLGAGSAHLNRAIANRVWSWFMGRGIIHEPDDIRPDNAAVSPELLAYLEKELVAGKYDLKRLFRLILNSATYQQSCLPLSQGAAAEANFAAYPIRRLDAEVLADALTAIGGGGQGYSSPIPEPFTFIPESQRAISLADGSITSPFLEMFGRPARDTGLESERNNQPTDAQRLYLLNSTDIKQKIERSPVLGRIMEVTRGNPRDTTMWLYLSVLSRYPTETEYETAGALFQKAGGSAKRAAEDLAWALVNSKEFLYRH